MNVRLENVSFTYPSGVMALRAIDLAIDSGETVAIIGENGAGKTTLAKHLNGLLKPGQGRVLIGDWDTRDHTVAQLAGRVGYAFQNADEQLFEQKVGEEVAFGPRNLGQSEEAVRANVDAALRRLGLEEVADLHPYDLQASQRKLVSLAAVLAMQTAVVILDEPTTGQDTRGLALLGEMVDQLKSSGRTVLTITHDIDFCADHFTRVVVMADGQILADGPAADILGQADLLERAGVVPPQIVRLASALHLPGTPLTYEQFAACLASQRPDAKDKSDADRSR